MPADPPRSVQDFRLPVSTAVPDIAVVIPTSGRETRLAFALEALAAQTLDPSRFEVLVVREPRQGATAQAPPGLGVRFLSRVRGASAAAARNVGWRAASAPLVAFTDDDCRPTPGWLEALLSAHGCPDTFVQGGTEPDPDEIHLLGGLARSQRIVGPSHWYETCNMAYPRTLLERLDGFDERYTAVCEDTDLALRAEGLGARRVFADRALVWHAVHLRTIREALSRAVMWDEIPSVLARHPVHRRAMYKRFFWKESHGKLVLALIGTACACVASRLGWAATLPYLQYRLDDRPRRPRALARRCLELPAHLLLDSTEVAVILRAAVRHRVVLA